MVPTAIPALKSQGRKAIQVGSQPGLQSESRRTWTRKRTFLEGRAYSSGSTSKQFIYKEERLLDACRPTWESTMVKQRLRTPRNVGCQSTFSFIFPLTKLSQEIISILATVHKKTKWINFTSLYFRNSNRRCLKTKTEGLQKNADTAIFSLVH